MTIQSMTIGIDAGTATFELAKISKLGTATPIEFPEGGTVLAAVVYFVDGKEAIVGQEAQNMWLVDPPNGRLHWKRSMGSDEILYTSSTGEEYLAEDLLVIYLRYCKDAAETDTGMIIRNVVISVPANYNDAQKDATIRAAKAVGFENVRLIHEPTAALFARLANTDRDVADGLRLVVDVGGGTTDISVCQKTGNRYEVKTTGGVAKLGGMDLTEAIMVYCVEEFRKVSGMSLDPQTHREELADIYRRCEDVKLRLNRTDRATVPIVVGADKHQVVITKDQMRAISQPLVDKLLQCIRRTLDEAGLTLENILELIPIGGGSQQFCVLEELELFFGRPLSNHADPIHAVANGAVLKGWEDLGQVNVDEATILQSRGFSLRDVTGHALGVSALDEAHTQRFTPVLDKGVRLPSCHQKTFRLAEEGATEALIEVYQGDAGDDLASCLKLGEFELTGLPTIFGKPHPIEIEFQIDANGMLTATAYCTVSGKQADLQITYEK